MEELLKNSEEILEISEIPICELEPYFIVKIQKDLEAELTVDIRGLLLKYEKDEHEAVIERVRKTKLSAAIEILQKKGVKFGIIEEVVSGIFSNGDFNKPFLVAQGKPPVNGLNGSVTEHFERERQIVPQLLENGKIDYKELGLVLDIQKATIIADITEETKPISGMGISGRELVGIPGKPPKVPKGKNTRTTADNKFLVSETSGNLIFQNGVFVVEESITIAGNVDASVGNIDFSGDVIVVGDVLFGYTITSKKNITVSGMVEGACLFADGNILLKSGINGQQKSYVFAKGEIKAKFIENCDVSAEGIIYSETIVNSNVSSEKSVVVTDGRGVITGGQVVAMQTIEAKTIGSDINILTKLRLGLTPETRKKIKELETSIAEFTKEIELIEKNIVYLEILEKQDNLSQDRKELLLKLRGKRPTLLMMQKRLEVTLAQKVELSSNVENCRVVVQKKLFPPIRVYFGSSFQRVISANYDKCTLFLKDGEIEILNI